MFFTIGRREGVTGSLSVGRLTYPFKKWLPKNLWENFVTISDAVDYTKIGRVAYCLFYVIPCERKRDRDGDFFFFKVRKPLLK